MLRRIDELILLLLRVWRQTRDPITLQALVVGLELRALIISLSVVDFPLLRADTDWGGDDEHATKLIGSQPATPKRLTDEEVAIFDRVVNSLRENDRSHDKTYSVIYNAEYRQSAKTKNDGDRLATNRRMGNSTDPAEDKATAAAEVFFQQDSIQRAFDPRNHAESEFYSDEFARYVAKQVERYAAELKENLAKAVEWDTSVAPSNEIALVDANLQVAKRKLNLRVIGPVVRREFDRAKKFALELFDRFVELAEHALAKSGTLNFIPVKLAARLMPRPITGEGSCNEKARVEQPLHFNKASPPHSIDLQSYLTGHHPPSQVNCSVSKQSPCSHLLQLVGSLIDELSGSHRRSGLNLHDLWVENPSSDIQFRDHLNGLDKVRRLYPGSLLSAVFDTAQHRVGELLPGCEVDVELSTPAILELFDIGETVRARSVGGIPICISNKTQVEHDADGLRLEIPWLRQVAPRTGHRRLSGGPFGWITLARRHEAELPKVAMAVASLALAVFTFRPYDWPH